MSNLFKEIKEIIDEWDPVELLITHAPPDEYDYESQQIFNTFEINKNMSIDSLARIIFNVFVAEFGEDTFTKSLEECGKIAKIIINSPN